MRELHIYQNARCNDKNWMTRVITPSEILDFFGLSSALSPEAFPPESSIYFLVNLS